MTSTLGTRLGHARGRNVTFSTKLLPTRRQRYSRFSKPRGHFHDRPQCLRFHAHLMQINVIGSDDIENPIHNGSFFGK